MIYENKDIQQCLPPPPPQKNYVYYISYHTKIWHSIMPYRLIFQLKCGIKRAYGKYRVCHVTLRNRYCRHIGKNYTLIVNNSVAGLIYKVSVYLKNIHKHVWIWVHIRESLPHIYIFGDGSVYNTKTGFSYLFPAIFYIYNVYSTNILSQVL